MTNGHRLCVLLIIILFVAAQSGTISANSVEDLVKIVSSDVIDEYRAAAAAALSAKYKVGDLGKSDLVKIARNGKTLEHRNSVIPALAARMANISKIDSTEQALRKAETLEGLVKNSDLPQVRKAAARALADFYISFHLAGIRGYSIENLELLATEGNRPAVSSAASDALALAYPTRKTLTQLKALTRTGGHPHLQQAAGEALSIRYSSPMYPSPGVSELRSLASDPELNHWIRAAAGKAFGRAAKDRFSISELTRISKEGPTEEIRSGASGALAEALIESGKTEHQLLKLTAAAIGWTPKTYRQALQEALTDRLHDC